MNLKRVEVLKMFNVMKELTDKEDTFFIHAVIKNERLLDPEIKGIEESNKTNVEGYEDYIKERNGLILKYADLNEDGNVKIVGQGFLLKEDLVDEGNKAFKELDEKYKDTLEKRIEEEKQFNELLEEEVEIELQQITLDHFPKKLSKEELKSLEPMIKEED